MSLYKKLKKLFKSHKEKKVEELTKIGVKEFGCSETYARICAESSVYERNLNISNTIKK